MIKLIIFGFDGVIITGSHEVYFDCYHKALESVGVKLGIEEEKRRIQERWGQHHERVLEGMLRENPHLLGKAIETYDKYYARTFTENLILVPGTQPLLKNLSKKYKLAIASGMIRKTMDELIKRFDIDYFEKIVTVDDLENREDSKPSPVMINKILDDLTIFKEETIMVGDAENDIMMAKNAGVIPTIVLTGHISQKEAEELGVKYIIPDITHLPGLLKSMH